MANIIVVDDEPKMTSLICGTLEDEGHTVTTTTKPAEALELIEKHSFDIVITDLSMPKISGMTILEKALEKGGADVIMMTAFGTVESAVSAMKKGAADYMLKPFSLAELKLQVDRVLEKQRLASLSGHYRQVINSADHTAFIGTAPKALAIKELITKVAPSEATVMITGKSGTGKELAARMVHDNSPRRDQPFIAINCAALTESLLESELFGHEKGAFTGAIARKRGRFELANKGTLFLDEIGELTPAIQSKLLRVLEEKQLVRVGGVDDISFDVRLVAATNRVLKEEVANGSFREDLYFRLNVFPIEMPNLAERIEDIGPLALHFLKNLNYPTLELTIEVSSLLCSYDWPGNIRELRNVIERAAILAGGEILTTEDFSLDIQDVPLDQGECSPGSNNNPVGLESTEKEMILSALSQSGGNKTEAAKLLRITRRRLYSRMKAHGISV